MISHARKNNINIDTDTESSSMTSDSEEDDFMEFNKNPKKKHLIKVDHKALDKIIDKHINISIFDRPKR